MKRFTFCLVSSIFFILISSVVSAQRMRYLNLTINLNEDETVDVETVFRFTEEIKEVLFPIKGKISELKFEHGSCEVEEQKITIIKCKPPSPYMVGEITIHTEFKIKNILEREGNITIFSFDIPILWNTDNVNIIVKLPTGMVLAEDVLLPISPSGSRSVFEKRKVVEIWELKDKRVGDIIPLRIYYEPVTPISKPELDIKTVIASIKQFIAFVVIVILVFLVFIYRKISERRRLVLSVLNEDERLIIDILTKNEGKIDQRRLVDISDFSKAKVSRLVQDLLNRGLIEVKRVGRKNKITLKKHLFGKNFLEDKLN